MDEDNVFALDLFRQPAQAAIPFDRDAAASQVRAQLLRGDDALLLAALLLVGEVAPDGVGHLLGDVNLRVMDLIDASGRLRMREVAR